MLKFMLQLAVFSCLGGCSQSVTFYPVEGPVAAIRPLPTLTAKADGITGNSGGIEMRLADGQHCSGKWSSAAPQFSATTSLNLIGVYGSAVGVSTSSGILPGVNRGEAFMSCSKGTTVSAEFFTGSGTANGYGVAKDTDGNIYKMLF